MPRKQKPIGKMLLAALGFSLVAIGSYSLYTELTVRSPQLQAPSAVAKASVRKRTPQEKAAYTVPSSHPRILTIKKLGISAAVLPVGTTNGALAAPASAWDVGWYSKSALPGSGSGTLLIDGHVNDALNAPGVFYSLSSLEGGDSIEIERGDGQKLSYKVKRVENKPLAEVDMSRALVSIEEGKEGLNIITCSGFYDEKKKTFDHRVLVFAVRT